MSEGIVSQHGVDLSGTQANRPSNAPAGITYAATDTGRGYLSQGSGSWISLGVASGRTTIANAGTITTAQIIGTILYQDASGGNVTMTTQTAANIVTAYPDWEIGEGRPVYQASNHASNTSTISGGTGVTVVGSGAVTNTGGQYSLVRTATSTFDLIRIG